MVTGVPVSRQTASPPGERPSFDVFTPIHRPGPEGPASGGSYENAYQDYGAADGSYGVSSSHADSAPFGNIGSHGNTGAFGNTEPFGNNAADAGSYQQRGTCRQ